MERGKSIGLHNMEEDEDLKKEIKVLSESNMTRFMKNETKKYFEENLPIPIIRDLPFKCKQATCL